jgi:hypothetical protein
MNDETMTITAELKLNIGCGTSGIEGWVNIDNSPSILLSRLPLGKRIFRTPDWPRDVAPRRCSQADSVS